MSEMDDKEYEIKSKQLNRIARALTSLGYPIVYEDETSVTFKVNYGYINLDYGDPRQENPIEIVVSEP